MNDIQMHLNTPPEPQNTTPRPVHTLLAETHLAQASADRREAAFLLRVRDDVKLHPESTELKVQLSAALNAVADARERLALSLAGTVPPRTPH